MIGWTLAVALAVADDDLVDPDAAEPRVVVATFEVGGGAVVVPREGRGAEPVGAFSVAGSHAFRVARDARVMPAWHTELVVHDFDAIGDIYRWYGTGTEDEVMLKVVGLFPGLVLAPLAGSRLAFGPSVRVGVSERWPMPFLDLGFNFMVFVRPTDPVMKFDVGGGPSAAVGVQLGPHVGIVARGAGEIPVVRTNVIGRPGLLWTTTASLAWMR